jgi:hypothetical protein
MQTDDGLRMWKSTAGVEIQFGRIPILFNQGGEPLNGSNHWEWFQWLILLKRSECIISRGGGDCVFERLTFPSIYVRNL